MLPAMASADEVDDDLGPPAPQGENYGYVRLVFSEGEQIDLYHGEYITECSPTAAVHDGADEDFLTDGDYLALYYEGKLYCKAALDGVSIDADAVLPVEDFALVPMGDDPTTLGEEHEDKTPPAVEVVEPEDESSGSDETVGTPPSTEPESKEEDKTTEDEGDPSGSDYNVKDDTRPQGSMRAPVMPTATGESGYIGVVNYDDDRAFFERMYDNSYLESMSDVARDGKFIFKEHTGSGTPSQYVLWYTGGVLHMKNYYGGRISTGNSKHLTILVEADSTITGDAQGCIDLETSIGQYHNVSISSDTGKKLTLNMNGSYGTVTAIESEGGNRTESTVTIEGSVKVEANVYNSSSSNSARAFGIDARDVTICDSASFKAVCRTEGENNSLDSCCYGIVANGTLTVNTTGTIDIDVSNASADERAYSIGLHGGSVDLQRVTYMKIKWANGYAQSGYAIYPKDSVIGNHAVGYPDNTTAIYRWGPPHKVVLTDCSIISATDQYSNPLYTTGTFLLKDWLTVEPEKHGIGVVGWYTNVDSFNSPAASGSTLVYQVPAASTDIRIKPLYRLGETGGLSFEWTGADTGRVRLKLRDTFGIDPNEIKLLDIRGNEVASGATYDNTSGMLSMEVRNIQSNSPYRLKTSHTNAKVDLYSDWFNAISVRAPIIDKPSGSYYGSMNVNVTAPTGTEVFYKTGSAEIYSGSEGTAFSGDPIAVDGKNSSLTLRARKSDKQGVTIWSTPVTATWTKLDTLPTPIVRFYDGENEVMPDSNNTVLFHEKLTVVLSKPSPWPVNAEMHYSTGGVSNILYKTPVEYTSAGTLRVYAVAALADGGTPGGGRVDYTIQQDPSHVTSTLSVRKDSNIKVYDINNVLLAPTTPGGISNKYTLNVGRQFTVEAPSKSGTKVFSYWSVSNGSPVDFDNKNSPRATFIMPNGDITVKANYDTPTNISEQTLIKFTPGNPAGMNMALHTSYAAWRSLSYQWYEGDTAAGTSLNSFDSFEIGKTYTAHVKVTATEGIIFTDAATIKVQRPGSILEVANDRVERAANNSYLAFDLHLITKPELTIEPVSGDTLPTAEALTAQLPVGYTVKTLTWASSASTAPSGATEVTISKLEIAPVDGSYQLAGESVWINGTERTGNYSSGTLTLTDITVPVKSKGVTVSGTAVSWNDSNDAQYYLYPSTAEDAAIRAQWKTGGTVTGYTCTGTGGAITATTVDGKSMKAQPFSFGTIPAGSYKLVIFKPGKYVPKIVPITVGTTDYTCGELKLWLYGDVNYDGKVKAGDATQILKYTSYKRTFSEEEMLAADVNNDGKIKAGDATQILKYTSYKASAFDNIP